MREHTVTLPISGMTCASCAANIERGFKFIPAGITMSVG